MNKTRELINNVEKIKKGYSTRFLDSKMQLELKNLLKKNEYQIYYPYIDSEKVIFYNNIEPNVSLLEIVTREKLEHREILGTVFSLGLDDSMFGDIIIDGNKYYIYVLDEIKDYFINNLLMIKKVKVNLEERDLSILENYKRKYEEIEIITSSERIDTVISHLIGINRTKIKDFVQSKYIILNYEVVSNTSKKLEIGDIFSIKRYGKYKYLGIIKYTRSGNLIIKIDKYI
ncbi:MAG: hypothetical protein IKN63_03235 [Bacilli bacterium]|nr:hypothetical protein [Bacilli bacterium]